MQKNVQDILNKQLLKHKPTAQEFATFVQALTELQNNIQPNETEEHNKDGKSIIERKTAERRSSIQPKPQNCSKPQRTTPNGGIARISACCRPTGANPLTLLNKPIVPSAMFG